MAKWYISWGNGSITTNAKTLKQAVRKIKRKNIEVGLLVQVRKNKEAFKFWSGDEFCKALGVDIEE